nr:hypothetical protein [Tanacetum cinerariifolium]
MQIQVQRRLHQQLEVKGTSSFAWKHKGTTYNQFLKKHKKHSNDKTYIIFNYRQELLQLTLRWKLGSWPTWSAADMMLDKNRACNEVPPTIGTKLVARVIYKKRKQGEEATTIKWFTIQKKKIAMINDKANEIWRNLQTEEASSSSAPVDICMEKLESDVGKQNVVPPVVNIEMNKDSNEPINEFPSSCVTKFSPTSLTKANLQKLDAYVPNDVNYDIWLPLASVHELWEGKCVLVDDDGKPMDKVNYSGNPGSEDEVEYVDNEMASYLALKPYGPIQFDSCPKSYEAVATDSSGVPSIIERSPLDFSLEVGASDQGTVAPEMSPSEDVPATDGAPAGGKSLAAIQLGLASTVFTPEDAPAGVSDPDLLSVADPPSRHPADVAQSSQGTAATRDPEFENASSSIEVGSSESGKGVTTALEIRAGGKAAEEVCCSGGSPGQKDSGPGAKNKKPRSITRGLGEYEERRKRQECWAKPRIGKYARPILGSLGNGGNQFRQYAGQYTGQNAGNLNRYNAVQNVRNQIAQNPRVQNDGNHNQIGNGNLLAVRAEGNAAGHNGNQIRCYNCRGLGHFARDCTVRPRRRDAAYLQTQLLIAQKEEARIQLQAEEYDLMATAADLDEIEEVNENCILMANLQQASSSGTQTDSTPVYDTDGSAEVIDVEQDGETVEQHFVNFEETHALYESLYQNLAVEVEKVNSV